MSRNILTLVPGQTLRKGKTVPELPARSDAVHHAHPTLSIPRLPCLPLSDLASALALRPDIPEIRLGQTWSPASRETLQSTTVRLARTEDSLLLTARLEDSDIFNAARALNERTWLLGDTFEMFFQDTETAHYVEFHVTPRNVRLQLLIPEAGRVSAAIPLPDPNLIASHTRIQPPGWIVSAEIPAQAVVAQPVRLTGRQWRFSFCRYDYCRGNPTPVLSSSSPLTAPSFHRLDEWQTMEFV